MNDNPSLLRAVNPDNMAIPNISMATLVLSGHLLFLSGHVPLRADGSIQGTDLNDQLEQVFFNLNSTLEAAGGNFHNLARITIYVRDLSEADLPIIRRIRDSHINLAMPPASALIGVSALFHPDIRVEVDAVAVIG